MSKKEFNQISKVIVIIKKKLKLNSSKCNQINLYSNLKIKLNAYNLKRINSILLLRLRPNSRLKI